MAERAAGPDFAIRDEASVTRIAEAHRHEYFQIQLNLAGETRQHIAATVRPLGPGHLSFVLPYRAHRIPHPPGSKFYVVSFNLRFLRPELDVDPLDLEDVSLARAPELAPFLYQEYLDFRLDGRDLAAARAACRSMTAEHERRGYCSRELVRGHLLLLIGTVCRRYEGELRALAARRAGHASRKAALARVVRHVRENLAGRLTLAAAAAAAGLSPGYLAHLIRKETGRTFVDLVTERRMERAKELLAHTPLRVGEIARAAGFGDEAYFARRFRQRYGMAPREFRGRAATAG
ncbi:MAG: AraC family transcriptional regulator [Burkholderiales bacterium]|nr:AraC family transcriptional regulator [Burkholderiales bacterium]